MACAESTLTASQFQTLTYQSISFGEGHNSRYNRGMTEAQRRARTIQLWLTLPPAKRTEDGVLCFYGWLREHAPELLPGGHGDSYQLLMLQLRPHIHAQARLDTLV